MNIFGEYFKINPGNIYKLEHLFETPIEKFLFGKTRYSSQDPLFRCMGARILWLNDILHGLYFGLRKKCNAWDQKEWDEFAKNHNEQLYDIIHCDIYNDMAILCKSEFYKPQFGVEEYIKYFIPLTINPSTEDIKRRLIH